MNKSLLLSIATALAFTTGSIRAEAPSSYQVTGPIVELSDTTIVVMKGKEKWELARNPDTKVTGELKVGAKVTIFYAMTAKSIEAKPEKTAKALEKAKPAM